jgi:hypothetical protein
VAAILLVYLSPLISATAVAVVLFLLSLAIFVYHLSVLPFHSTAANMVRGGIYLAAVEFTIGNLIVLHNPGSQRLQNWLLGGIPVAFVVGMFIVYHINATVLRYLSVLRGQWDELVKAASSSKSRRVSMVSMVSEATQLGGQLAERSMHEKFFDVKWAAQRRFRSGSAAYLATRVLLQQRVQDDTPFLLSLLNQTLKDHPNSQDLSVFHLLVLRYVFKERSQAVAQVTPYPLPPPPRCPPLACTRHFRGSG